MSTLSAKKSGIPTSTSKMHKSKVRAVPDFKKLHDNWTNKLEHGKSCGKKPRTVVREFGVTGKGSKFSNADPLHSSNKENTPTKARIPVPAARKRVDFNKIVHQSFDNLKNQPDDAENQFPDVLEFGKRDFSLEAKKQQDHGIEFEVDRSALESILSNRGLSPEVTFTFKTPKAALSSTNLYTPKRVPVSGNRGTLGKNDFGLPRRLPVTDSRPSLYVPRNSPVCLPCSPSRTATRTPRSLRTKQVKIPGALLGEPITLEKEENQLKVLERRERRLACEVSLREQHKRKRNEQDPDQIQSLEEAKQHLDAVAVHLEMRLEEDEDEENAENKENPTMTPPVAAGGGRVRLPMQALTAEEVLRRSSPLLKCRKPNQKCGNAESCLLSPSRSPKIKTHSGSPLLTHVLDKEQLKRWSPLRPTMGACVEGDDKENQTPTRVKSPVTMSSPKRRRLEDSFSSADDAEQNVVSYTTHDKLRLGLSEENLEAEEYVENVENISLLPHSTHDDVLHHQLQEIRQRQNTLGLLQEKIQKQLVLNDTTGTVTPFGSTQPTHDTLPSSSLQEPAVSRVSEISGEEVQTAHQFAIRGRRQQIIHQPDPLNLTLPIQQADKMESKETVQQAEFHSNSAFHIICSTASPALFKTVQLLSPQRHKSPLSSDSLRICDVKLQEDCKLRTECPPSTKALHFTGSTKCVDDAHLKVHQTEHSSSGQISVCLKTGDTHPNSNNVESEVTRSWLIKSPTVKVGPSALSHKDCWLSPLPVGSLSLAANLMSGQVSRISGARYSSLHVGSSWSPMAPLGAASQSNPWGLLCSEVNIRYHDALLDQEIDLFTSLAQPCIASPRTCRDPLAHTLTVGDSLHFLPIQDCDLQVEDHLYPVS